MGCFRQVRQEIFYKKKIANKTIRQKIKTIRRMRRSVDRMSEEKRVLREAEVAKEKEFFNSQIQIVSNAECQKMFKGIFTIVPKHICGHKSGSPPFFFNSLTPCCYQSHISGVDACQGDSGGPLSIIQGGRQTQVKG